MSKSKSGSVVNNGATQETPEKKVKAEAKVYTSKAEALANKTDAKYQLFQVSAPGKDAVWVWAKWHQQAVFSAAKAAGYKATTEGKAPDKAKVADMMSRLSDEDRAALIAQYVPGKKK
jgi:hypothetical protein